MKNEQLWKDIEALCALRGPSGREDAVRVTSPSGASSARAAAKAAHSRPLGPGASHSARAVAAVFSMVMFMGFSFRDRHGAPAARLPLYSVSYSRCSVAFLL